MICPCCEEERKGSDFINSTNCYKCEFKRRTDEVEKNEDLFCRMCSNECTNSRWKYCSEECAILGKVERDSHNWTKKIKSVTNFSAKGIPIFRKRKQT